MVAAVVTIVLVVAGPDAAARAVLEKHECAKCHVVEGVAAPPVERACAACHADVATSPQRPAQLAEAHRTYGKATWDRFVARASRSYVSVPSLVGMERLRGSWLRTFLASPYDVRPGLDTSMIRHNLTATELETLVRGWRAEEDEAAVAIAPGRMESGRALYLAKGCNGCHALGDVVPIAAPPTTELDVRSLAPDLRHARDRMNTATLVTWIVDPKVLKHDSAMAALGVTRDEAASIAAYVQGVSLGAPSPRKTARPPAYDPATPVPTYEEVERIVFHRTCVHCHADPARDAGEGGPGNTGGFGFEGVALSFADYDQLMRGSKGPDGKRRSIFRVGETGEPVLLERLRRRYVENDRDHVGATSADLRVGVEHAARGMPLGLPAIDPAAFALVERWVRGGHPGPAKRARAAQTD